MAVKPEQILTYLELDPEAYDSEEAMKAAIDEKFSKRADFDKLKGSMNGLAKNTLVRAAKKHGVDAADIEKAEKPLELFEAIADKIAENYRSEIESLKKQAEGKGGDTAEIEKKLERAAKERDDAIADLQKVSGEFETFKGELTKKEQQAKVNAAWDAAIAKVNWAPGVSDITKRGFRVSAMENYRIEIGEDGSTTFTDKDGNRIKDPKAHGKFRGPEDVLIDDAKKEKLTADAGNANAGKPVQRPTNITQPPKQDDGPRRRPVHPNAMVSE